MSEHVLKTIDRYFDAVADGTKTFEVRKNDRAFQKGDTLILERWKDTEYGPRRSSPHQLLSTKISYLPPRRSVRDRANLLRTRLSQGDTAMTPAEGVEPVKLDAKALPCPFCGADSPHVETPTPRHAEGEDRLKLLQPYVLCLRCGGIGPNAPTKTEALAAWNRRALSPVSPSPAIEHVVGARDEVISRLTKMRAVAQATADMSSDAIKASYQADADALQLAIRAASVQSSMSAQGGWVIVPREPDDAMIEAGLESLREHTQVLGIARDPLFVWRYMLAASPIAPRTSEPRDAYGLTEDDWNGAFEKRFGRQPDATAQPDTLREADSYPSIDEAYDAALAAAETFYYAASVEETNWTGWGDQVAPFSAEMRRVKANQALTAIRDADPRRAALKDSHHG